jgi:hypothetical protein
MPTSGVIKLNGDDFVLDNEQDVAGDIDEFFDMMADDWALIDVISDNATETDMGSISSSTSIGLPAGTQQSRGRAAKSSSRGPIHKQSRPGRLQQTRGEPCLLKVCQFPVRISNAINMGDLDLINSIVDSFLTKDCILRGIFEHANTTICEGTDKLKAYLAALVELMPDVCCEVKTIKLREGQCVVFKLNCEGTFINSFQSDVVAMNEFANFFQRQLLGIFDKYTSQLADESMIAEVEKLRAEVKAENGQHCYNKCVITGRLMFHDDAIQSWDNNEEPLQGATVDRLSLSCEITSVTPTSV